MRNWIANGAPWDGSSTRTSGGVSVYTPGKSLHIIAGDTVEGSGPVQGFTLNLAKVWRFYET